MTTLPPVEGDMLPPIGSKVLIHLSSLDRWVEHTVAGYYVWGDHGKNPHLHRVFVRVMDTDGILNARLLCDVRPVEEPKLSYDELSKLVELLQQQKSDLDEEVESLRYQLDDLANNMVYNGNSVAYIYQKMMAYRKSIDDLIKTRDAQ